MGSFVSLGQALWGDSIGRARGHMDTHWWADVRLGALHGVVLSVLAIVSRNHPLLGLLTLALIGFALTCLWMAIPALVQRLGERIVPVVPGSRAILGEPFAWFGDALFPILVRPCCWCFCWGPTPPGWRAFSIVNPGPVWPRPVSMNMNRWSVGFPW